ncbi:MAG: putative manganese-dependent inorganic diphosphatase [Coriobacteriia bacterium]|nr:putative manganese-dependent inorganic diphosphatase [Coriobacteriia bacterium]
MGPILVFGHRNPDNDSICSAVAYAHLKNLTDPGSVYVPVRLGPMPPETSWVFERFGLAAPAEITHVRTRVRDVMTTDIVCVSPDDTLLTVGHLLAERGVRGLPVVDGGVVRGLVTMQALATRYVEDLTVSGFKDRPVTVSRLVEVLEGSLLAGDAASVLSGNVLIGAMEPQTMLRWVHPGDTLIVGDRRRTQPMAVEAGIACLVVTGGGVPDEELLALARERACAVVSTAKDTYGAARLVNLSHTVGSMMETDTLVVEPDALLAEAADDLFASPQREAIVLDADGALVGLLTRTNVARAPRRQVILMDHNETSQSADGVEEASVVEIVDHHRIGDIETAYPISFMNLPLGSTATIVALRYRELGVDPPRAMAGLMLSALLTDTVMLKSPTATETDREIADRLAADLGVDHVEFGMEMFRARSQCREFSAEHVVKADLKEYRVGDTTVAIAQVETVDLDEVLSHRDETVAYMEHMTRERGYGASLLMVTDVVREGSELIVVGKRRIAERAFGVSFESGSAWFDGMLSRKKQVAPRLVESAGR